MSKEAELRDQYANEGSNNEEEKEKKLSQKLQGDRHYSEGISLAFFKQNCSFLAGCRPNIVERILIAHGLDIESANSTINWNTYLELYCIFEAGKMEKQSLIKFWIKFFDIGLRETVPEEHYMPVLEELVRGSTLNEPSKTTVLFAKMF